MQLRAWESKFDVQINYQVGGNGSEHEIRGLRDDMDTVVKEANELFHEARRKQVTGLKYC